METIVTVTHLFVSLALIALILIQHGKGADAGAAFGSGASGTVFGANGAANFLSRSTAFLATSFFVLSLALGWFAINTTKVPDLIIDDNTPAPVIEQKKTEPSIPEIPVVTTTTEEKIVPSVPVATTITEEKNVPSIPEAPVATTITEEKNVPSIPETPVATTITEEKNVPSIPEAPVAITITEEKNVPSIPE